MALDYILISGYGITGGTSGTDGVDGAVGISGTSGTDGVDGSIGTSGTSGDSGTSGTDGVDGTSGTSGDSGTSGTSGDDGVDGDNGTSGTSGVDGDSGTSGTSGVNGATGTSGTSGANGATGTSGTSGTSGANGATGAAGTSGTSGANGATGTSGTSGTSGANGATGTSGTSGDDGAAGTSGTDGGGSDYLNWSLQTNSGTRVGIYSSGSTTIYDNVDFYGGVGVEIIPESTGASTLKLTFQSTGNTGVDVDPTFNTGLITNDGTSTGLAAETELFYTHQALTIGKSTTDATHGQIDIWSRGSGASGQIVTNDALASYWVRGQSVGNLHTAYKEDVYSNQNWSSTVYDCYVVKNVSGIPNSSHFKNSYIVNPYGNDVDLIVYGTGTTILLQSDVGEDKVNITNLHLKNELNCEYINSSAGMANNFTIFTSTQSLTDDHRTILTSGATTLTITLPLASAYGEIEYVCLIGNGITLARSGSDTIWSSATNAFSTTLTKTYGTGNAIYIHSDGSSKWYAWVN